MEHFNLEFIVPILTVILAFVLAALDYFRKWEPKTSTKAVLYLLVMFLTSEVILRLLSISRIESKIDDLAVPNQQAQLVVDPHEVWDRAKKMLESSHLSIIDTTSLRNPPDYEAQISRAIASGATITRVICSPSSRQLKDLIDPTVSNRNNVQLLHIPFSFPFDFLVAEASGSPTALIGLRPRSKSGTYEVGIQINEKLAAQRIKELIEGEFMRLADEHSRTEGAKCSLCREINGKS